MKIFFRMFMIVLIALDIRKIESATGKSLSDNLKQDFLFSSLAKEAKLKYYYLEKMKEAKKNILLEAANKRRIDLEKARKHEFEKRKKLEEQIYKDRLISRVTGTLFKDFNFSGRFW
jgi:hypothetical protein